MLIRELFGRACVASYILCSTMIIIVTACGGDSKEASGCASNDECKGGRICVFGECVYRSDVDAGYAGSSGAAGSFASGGASTGGSTSSGGTGGEIPNTGGNSAGGLAGSGGEGAFPNTGGVSVGGGGAGGVATDGGTGGTGGTGGGFCGDGVCNGTETSSSCCTDCACPANYSCQSGTCTLNAYCGDGLCNNGETTSSCCSDCGCATSGYVCQSNSCVPPCSSETFYFYNDMYDQSLYSAVCDGYYTAYAYMEVCDGGCSGLVSAGGSAYDTLAWGTSSTATVSCCFLDPSGCLVSNNTCLYGGTYYNCYCTSGTVSLLADTCPSENVIGCQ